MKKLNSYLNIFQKQRFSVSYIIIVSIMFLCSLCSYGNVVPRNMSDVPNGTIGLYQTDKKVTVYSKPDVKSSILYERNIEYVQLENCENDSFFSVLIPDKELGYVYVTDIADDENWVEIIYDKVSQSKGWVYKNDDFQFMSWNIFFNMYGRKYGLIKLKNDKNEYEDIYSQTDFCSQILGKIGYPKYIKLIAIEGTWILVTVLDISDTVSTGYVRWLDDNGHFVFFPNLK